MSTNINKTVFGKAMDAALDGPEQKGLKFRNHGFQVRTITKTPNGAETHVKGTMFHQVNNFFDNKINYSFDVNNGRVENLAILFKKGTDVFVDIVNEAIKIAGEVFFSSNTAPEKIARTEPAKGTEALLKDDGWKAEARFLVANIAFRVPRNA
jgi:hypothetical protein